MTLRVVSHARNSAPLPFLRRKHRLLTTLLRWNFFRKWVRRRSLEALHDLSVDLEQLELGSAPRRARRMSTTRA